MKVLVTGSAGFIGSHLVSRMRGLHDVVQFDLKQKLDICSSELPEVEAVIHLAANTNAFSKDFLEMLSVNANGTLRLLEKYHDKPFIYAGTIATRYTHAYGISKLTAVQIVKQFQKTVVTFPNITGDGGHGVWDIFKKSPSLDMYGDGSQERTFASVESACDLLLLALANYTPEYKEYKLNGFNATVKQIANIYPQKNTYFLTMRDNDVLDGTV